MGWDNTHYSGIGGLDMRKQNMKFVEPVQEVIELLSIKETVFNLINTSTSDWTSSEILDKLNHTSSLRGVQQILSDFTLNGSIVQGVCRCHKSKVYSSNVGDIHV